MVQERGVDPADLISFLLELSFHVTGEAYDIDTLSDEQRYAIKDLADLGLVKLQQGRKESWFIPTKLATNLSMSLADSSSRKQVAYCLSILLLLCHLRQPFHPSPPPSTGTIVLLVKRVLKSLECHQNMVTREKDGDNARQKNAHPRVAERIPSVPENVTDQIRLWESDLNRVDITPAHFYDEFPSREVFEAACDYAREWNGLLWEDSKNLRLVVKADIHTHMREHLRRQKNPWEIMALLVVANAPCKKVKRAVVRTRLLAG
uniref:RNA polymerase II transcription factor B subunit 2 n=1 Tax=Cucumis melo TaxID=3656 RepID=A0A9I9CRH4_CUCME